MNNRRVSDVPTVRILVLGDSGVGKTSLCHALVTGQPLRNARMTIGACTHILKRTNALSGGDVFVEFVDVAGHRKFTLSRNVFYYDISAVAIVFDVANRASYTAIARWISALTAADRVSSIQPAGTSTSIGAMPVIAIGNKIEQRDARAAEETFPTIKDFGLSRALVSATNVSAGNKHQFAAIEEFISSAIQHRYNAGTNVANKELTSSSSSSYAQRRVSPLIPRTPSQQLTTIQQTFRRSAYDETADADNDADGDTDTTWRNGYDDADDQQYALTIDIAQWDGSGNGRANSVSSAMPTRVPLPASNRDDERWNTRTNAENV